jgi:hypothetical protein
MIEFVTHFNPPGRNSSKTPYSHKFLFKVLRILKFWNEFLGGPYLVGSLAPYS